MQHILEPLVILTFKKIQVKKYLSNSINLVFALAIIASSCTSQYRSNIPNIDTSIIKVDSLIWDLETLQKIPKYEFLDSTSKVREILFKGPDYLGKPTKVFAYYSNPDILKTGVDQGNEFPGVVLISGGNQPAIREWVERWAHEGYAAITCDYGNTKLAENRGPAPSTLEETLALIYDSITHGPDAVRAYRTASIAIQAHSLLLSFPEVEKDKTAVTGISWGGFQTCIVSGIDNRFKAAAPVYGCAFHDKIIFKREFADLTNEQVSLWMNKIDPKNYIVYSKCPTLFITGNKDGCFDIVPFDKTTKLIQESNRHIKITPNMGHSHPDGWEPKEIASFFNSIFKEGIPLPKITGIEKQDSIIRFSYESSLTLKDARLYYSNDTININEKRIWESIPAEIFQDRIESQYPSEGFKFAFLYTTDVIGLSISSELLID